MKNLSVGLVLSALLLFGAAFAQNEGVVVVETESPYYAGASLGYTSAFGVSSFTLSGHFALRDFITEDFDLRLDTTVLTRGGNSFSIGALAIYNFSVSDSLPVSFYAGAGPEIFLGGGSAFGLALRGGADYALSSDLGAFAELRLDPVFGGGGNVTLFGLGAGVKFFF